jgi:hypothetical protein
VCLIGDIDLIPLSLSFFTTQIEGYDDSSYLHINGDAYSRGNHNKWREDGSYCELPAYGHIARGDVFHAAYSFEKTFDEEMLKYSNTQLSKIVNGEEIPVVYADGLDPHLYHANNSVGGKWGHDEAYSTRKLFCYFKSGGKVETNMSIPSERRVDRSRWQYDSLLVQSGWYIDSHLLRPYSRYKTEITKLMDLVPDRQF